jgi:hypothetical protein
MIFIIIHEIDILHMDQNKEKENFITELNMNKSEPIVSDIIKSTLDDNNLTNFIRI